MNYEDIAALWLKNADLLARIDFSELLAASGDGPSTRVPSFATAFQEWTGENEDVRLETFSIREEAYEYEVRQYPSAVLMPALESAPVAEALSSLPEVSGGDWRLEPMAVTFGTTLRTPTP